MAQNIEDLFSNPLFAAFHCLCTYMFIYVASEYATEQVGQRYKKSEICLGIDLVAYSVSPKTKASLSFDNEAMLNS